MNAIDSILDGDEPVVQAISNSMGVLAAEQYVEEFNNGCVQMSGVEEVLMGMRGRVDVFLSPLPSFSTRMDH